MESVSRSCLINLAFDLGGDWKKLGRVLELSSEVGLIIQDYRNNVCEQAYRLLLAWQQKNTSKATYEVLGEALRKPPLMRVDLAENYCEGGYQDTLKTGVTHLQEHFKCQKLTEPDLVSIANELGKQWIWVGRLLELDDTALDGIKDEHNTLYDWSYEMLSLWVRKNSTEATYGWLAKVLCHRVAGLNNVAKKYCVEHQGARASCIPHEEKINFVTQKMEQLQVRLPSKEGAGSSTNFPSSTEQNSETDSRHPPQVPDDCVRKHFVTRLQYTVLKNLIVKLNPLRELGGDYRDLAGKMGYDMETIQYFQSLKNPTESLLSDCSAKVSIEKLCNKLDAIRRSDARAVIDDWVKSQNCKCTLCCS